MSAKSSVVEIDDGLSYIQDADGEISAVQWFKRNQFVHFENNGYVSAMQKTDGSGIGRHELKNLMIMWLALNYPDVLAYDKRESEDNIRSGTQPEN